jgi:hypothetical protein
VTPGLESRRPQGSGVTAAEGRRGAQTPAGRRRPCGSSIRTSNSWDCLPSCPLLRPPRGRAVVAAARRLRREHLLDVPPRQKVHESGELLSGSDFPGLAPSGSKNRRGCEHRFVR